MKKFLRGVCKRVGKEAFCKGLKNLFLLFLMAFLVAVMVRLLILCPVGTPATKTRVYEVKTSSWSSAQEREPLAQGDWSTANHWSYETSEESNRKKVPVVKEKAYLIVEGEMDMRNKSAKGFPKGKAFWLVLGTGRKRNSILCPAGRTCVVWCDVVEGEVE